MSNKNNKLMVIAPVILSMMMMIPLLITTQRVSAIDRNDMSQPYFNVNKDGTTTFSSTPITTDHSKSTSTSKAESASSADSQNNVKCFAFCLGISNANSGSAADSNSRTNSPGNTATALPVSPQSATVSNGRPFSPSFPVNHHHDGNDVLRDHGITVTTPAAVSAATTTAASAATGISCLDISGSAQDQGYAKGYVDGNRDSVGLNGHGFDDSLHGNHTPEFRQGYHDGYLAGWSDGKNGINQNPC